MSYEKSLPTDDVHRFRLDSTSQSGAESLKVRLEHTHVKTRRRERLFRLYSSDYLKLRLTVFILLTLRTAISIVRVDRRKGKELNI